MLPVIAFVVYLVVLRLLGTADEVCLILSSLTKRAPLLQHSTINCSIITNQHQLFLFTIIGHQGTKKCVCHRHQLRDLQHTLSLSKH